MAAGSGPRAIVVRHVGGAVVVGACIAASVVARHDGDHVSIVWIAGLFYLAFCMEPVRRVLREARLDWTAAAVYLATAFFCIGAVFSMPVTDYASARAGSSSVLSLVGGNDDLSSHAQGVYTDLTWVFVALMAIGTLVLWYRIMQLARRTEWKAIDHTVGDGAFATGATLQQPLGSSVTRPAEPRERPRR